MAKTPDTMFWLSSDRDIYIPRDFAKSFADRAKSVRGVDAEQWGILEAGPDHEFYWDAWTEVTDQAVVTDENGHEYFVYQDGDCWLVPRGMEWDDDNQFFAWPSDEDISDDDENNG